MRHSIVLFYFTIYIAFLLGFYLLGSFTNTYFFTLCILLAFLHVCLCTKCVQAFGGQRRMSDTLGLELR